MKAKDKNQEKKQKHIKAHKIIVQGIHELTGYSKVYIREVLSGKRDNPVIKRLNEQALEDPLGFLERVNKINS